ncbi:MAG: rhomboid family intramembrane serine protease [Alphaproteobacteria bacterium]|nr:rhomboid family intramembrane serine protease [Alphaproteobacteria bacterium]
MAFLQSQSPRQPIFRAPQVVLWLIGGLAAAHGARTLLSPARSADMVYEYALVPARYSRAFLESHMADPGTVLERAVPFVSYMALHNDWTHLLINCLWLLAFGPVVARRLGASLFLVFFLVCGVAGAVTYLAFNWASPLPVIGASGAISGLMAAGLRMLPGQAPWAAPGDAPLAPIFSRQILMFSVVWAAINLLAGLTGLGMGGESGLIAWQAHLGGFLAGLLLCGPFDALRPRTVGAPLDR